MFRVWWGEVCKRVEAHLETAEAAGTRSILIELLSLYSWVHELVGTVTIAMHQLPLSAKRKWQSWRIAVRAWCAGFAKRRALNWLICYSSCVQLAFREVSAVWATLKLNGERRFLLLRFRPRTVLSLVRNPDHTSNKSNMFLSVLASRHQCLSHINEQLETWIDTQTVSCAKVNSQRVIRESFLEDMYCSNVDLWCKKTCNFLSWCDNLREWMRIPEWIERQIVRLSK